MQRRAHAAPHGYAPEKRARMMIVTRLIVSCCPCVVNMRTLYHRHHEYDRDSATGQHGRPGGGLCTGGACGGGAAVETGAAVQGAPLGDHAGAVCAVQGAPRCVEEKHALQPQMPCGGDSAGCVF